MTAPRDPDRMIQAFLDEDVAELPARAYDVVRHEIDRTRQRVVIGPWRTPDVNTHNKVLTGAVAAVAVVAVAAVIGLRPSLGLIGGPAASPTQAPTATAAPLASDSRPLPSDGGVVPGRYTISGPQTLVRVTMPAGWTAGADATGSPLPDPMTVRRQSSDGGGFLDLTLSNDVTQVVMDVCVGLDDEIYADVGPTVGALTNALAAQVERQKSEALAGPTDVWIGGYAAKKFVLTYPIECPGPEGRWIWANGTVGQGAGIMKNATTTIYVIDVNGVRNVITSSYRAASDDDIAELDAIIASISIEPVGVGPVGSGRTQRALGKEAIVAGPYVLSWPGRPADARIGLTIPDGWWNSGAEDPSISEGSGFISQPTLNLAVHTVSRVVASVCPSSSSLEVGPTLVAVGPTVDDLVAAIGHVGGTHWSDPETVTIGGYPAKRLVTTFSPDCPGPPNRWIWVDDREMFPVQDGVTSTIYVVDVDGARLVITTDQRGASPEEVAQLESVIASLRIEGPPVAGRPPTPAPQPDSPEVFPVSVGTDGDVRIGRHAATVDGVSFSFEVPSVEWEPQTDFYLTKSFMGPQDAEAILRWTTYPRSRYVDPCPGLLRASFGPSVAGLAGAVAAAPGVEVVTGPTDVFVGGHPAKHVVVTVRDDIGCDPGYFYTYEPVHWGAMWEQTDVGDRISVWLVDVNGTLFVIEGETHGAAPLANEEIRQMVDSIRFE